MADTYAVADYGRMIADPVRTRTYARALEGAVRPGAVVLDIGTGTGIFALLACRYGARRVYAVEPGDVIQTAREIARANGLEDRIVFLQDVSERVELPERADVIVADVRGALPFFGRAIPALMDAHERLLAPGGVMIPRRDTVYVAPVEAAETYATLMSPWDEASFGFDMDAARRVVANGRTKVRGGTPVLRPQLWTTLDYRTMTDPDARGTMEWSVERASTAHGIAVWFETELAEGIGFATGPETETVYGTAFFPWPRAVELAPGDRVTVELEARLLEDYVWSWSTRIAGSAVHDFTQSTFLSEPISLARLHRRGDDFRPALSEHGRIDALALSRMDGATPLGDVARELHERFPGRFSSWEEALLRVGKLSEQYSA